MGTGQMGLLLWKNYLVRKRQPGILGLVFLWPIAIFLLLYTVRHNVEPEYNPTCQFSGRMLPQNGLLPFLRSFVCSIGNPCEPLSAYETVPSYRNATLEPLFGELEPLLGNDTLVTVIKNLPKGTKLLESMAQTFTQPHVKLLFEKGIHVGDLFLDHEFIKSHVKSLGLGIQSDLIDAILQNATINLAPLVDSFGSTDIDDILCSSETLAQYLVVPNDLDLNDVTQVLCNLDSVRVVALVNQLTHHLNIQKFLDTLDRAMSRFRKYDFLNDLSHAVEQLLQLKTIERFVPSYLKLERWLPFVIPLFRNVTFRDMDLTFINKSLALLEPIFQNDPDWPVVHHALSSFNQFLTTLEEILRQSNPASDQHHSGPSSLTGTQYSTRERKELRHDIGKAFDLAYVVLMDGVTLTNRLIDHHQNEIGKGTELLDALRNIFPKNVLNLATYFVSLTEKIVRTVEHVATLYSETPSKLYKVSLKHKDLVKRILGSLKPTSFETVVRSFSHAMVAEHFIEEMDKLKDAGQAICEDHVFREIFNVDVQKHENDSAVLLKDLLCNNQTKKFISEIYDSFELDNFQDIVVNTLSTFVTMAFQQPVALEKSNVTSLLSSMRKLFEYFDRESVISIGSNENDWQGTFDISQEWMEIFKKNEATGRLDVLAVHLAMAKLMGLRSLAYVSIIPDLKRMDVLAGTILDDVESEPNRWIFDVRNYRSQLLNTFYLTLANREKVLKILELKNFTQAYCNASISIELLEYPESSNDVILKKTICRLSSLVEMNLDRSVTDLDKSISTFSLKKYDFNWTAFNDKTIKIYKHIDSLLHEEDLKNYELEVIERSRQKFINAWTADLSIQDAWEISIGLICKLFTVMESPLFNVQSKVTWRNLYALAWATDVIQEHLETLLQHLQEKNYSLELSEVLREMPQTTIVAKLLLENLVPITLDILDTITLMRPLHLFTGITEYQNHEPDWPCIRSESIGDVLDLRNGSRQVVREIERISCNPGLFLREWTDQPAFTRLRKIWGTNDKDDIQSFDWTLGYVKFRHLVANMSTFIEKSDGLILPDMSPSFPVYVNKFLPEVKKTFEERSERPVGESGKRTLLELMEFLDLQIDKSAEAFQRDASASDVLTRSYTNNGKGQDKSMTMQDRILILTKFISRALDEISRVILNILRSHKDKAKQNGSIDVLSVLGFADDSPVAIAYHRFAEILATLVNGLDDPKFLTLIRSDSAVSCSDIFSWFTRSRVPRLSERECTILKNFTCDADPENVNLFTDLYLRETLFWKKPVSEYRCRFARITFNFYELGETLQDGTLKSIVIEPPYSSRYLYRFLESLKENLKNSQYKFSNQFQELSADKWPRSQQLLMAALSQLLSHATDALHSWDQKAKEEIGHSKARVLYSWNFVKDGDIRQLVKLLEAHPLEAVSLLPKFTEFDTFLENNETEFMLLQKMRETVCDLRFEKDGYWKQSSRQHFLNELCSFDLHQLLRSAIGEQFLNAALGRTQELREIQPLSTTIISFIDIFINLTTAYPELSFRSNLINATTWRNLPTDTKLELIKFQKSWIRSLMRESRITFSTSGRSGNNKRNETGNETWDNAFDLVRMNRFLKIVSGLVHWISGGDIWQKVRDSYKESKIEPLLDVIEELPNLLASGVDTFLYSNQLNDYILGLFAERNDICDFDHFLLVPSFIHDDSLRSRLRNFCTKVLKSQENLSSKDFVPFNKDYNTAVSGMGISSTESSNETYFFHNLEHFQSILIRSLSDGFESPELPKWWISFKNKSLKEFRTLLGIKNPKELSRLVVQKSMLLLRGLLESSSLSINRNCSWCSVAENAIDILNSQLSQHALYGEYFCKAAKWNSVQLKEAFLGPLGWNKTMTMIQGHEIQTQNKTRTLEEFVRSLEVSLNYVLEIIIDYSDAGWREKTVTCFYEFVGGPNYSRAGLWISLGIGGIDILRHNLPLLNSTEKQIIVLGNLSRMVEKSVPIWTPLSEVIKPSEIKNIERLLPNASINVNLFSEVNGENSSSIYKILSSKKSGKLIRFSSSPRQQLQDTCSSCLLEISEALSRSVDRDILKHELPKWREKKTWDLIWLDEALEHLSSAMAEVATLLDLARKVDFNDVSKIMQAPDIVDGILKLLQDKTVDKLFEGFNEILDDVEPFLTDPIIKEDLHKVLEIFESLEIFKNLGLLNVKYPIKEMFINWDELKSFLVKDIQISDDVVERFARAKIDTISILRKQQKNINFGETICSPQFHNIVRFGPGPFNAENVSSMLCHFDEQQTRNLTVALLEKINFPYILHNLMSINVKTILSKADLTKDEAKELMSNFTVVGQLVRNFAKILPAESLTFSEPFESTSPLGFFEDAGKMMCGRAVIGKTRGLYKVLSRIEEQKKKFDEEELASLPTDFCRETYKNIVKMNGGKIIWSYVKPLLRGRILYTPRTKVLGEVMSLANQSFTEFEKLQQVVTGFGKSLASLVQLSSKDRLLEDLQEVLSSETMKLAIQSFLPDNADLDDGPLDLDLPRLARWLSSNGKLLQNVNTLEKLMECVLVDRIRGFDTEEDLEREADVLTHTNEFLAGVVFIPRSGRSRRSASFQDSLPANVTYKIRMDVDYVPTTSRLKNQFWSPGPESNFIEDLRYLRGFIQLQDSIDRAIIRSKIRRQTDIDPSTQDWTTLTRQMPYPCWKYAPFQSTLYESQGIQTCFFFALMMCVGAAIRHIVWERESQNAMVMNVMGLKPWKSTLAWYLTTFIELVIVMVSICTILTFGKILPRSDPSLLLFLLFTYIFSVVSFCYMISRMFSSASLAAVTGVVTFLLTYMPYVVVIAMEANMQLGYKIFMCLSMSTSFSYGCLYAVRREVQGTGLTWGILWEESSPEDSMSLGLVLLMLIFDGCLYTSIGYFISRYTNSGYIVKELFTLESRYRPLTCDTYIRSDYTELINDYYLTNEVAQPSSTHQESENNTSSVIINEKQIGVSFEGVRKVYRLEDGRELVAVEDLNLKLHEDEVTALLGRNGAGKTTIIKMLTGMLAPSNGEIRLGSSNGTKPEIGVCPQDNVLVDCLTAREHMLFYAKLKKPDAQDKELLVHVNTMLESLELGEQEDEIVSRLSGGTRRRLCVALAFLASPKFVILDEPGAGVDPAARRRIWRLIDKHRQGRTVLLSTHHLDEADMLSDTVVLMHKARILWVGSPLSLKTSYGKGYKLHILFAHPHDTGSSQRSTASLSEIPGATAQSLTTTSLGEKRLETLISLLASVVPNVTLNENSGSHLSVTLPFNGPHGASNDIAGVARLLEENRHSLNFSHFSLECDDLESVFLELCGDTEHKESAWQGRGGRDRLASRASISSAPSIGRDPATRTSTTTVSLGMSATTERLDLIGTEERSNLGGFAGFSQAKALLQKRLWHFARDWRAPLAALLLPMLFVAVAMGFSLIRPPSADEPPLLLSPNLYETNSHAPIHFYSIDNNVMNYNFLKSVSQELRDRFATSRGVATWQMSLNDTGSCQCVDGEQQCHSITQSKEGLVETPPGQPTLHWIISTHQQYIEKRYGGWSLGDTKNGSPLFTVWYNNKGHHSLPAYLSALNEAILRASGIPGHITTINHPLKLSRDQLNRTSLIQHVADVGVALVLLIAFSLVGAQGARELVRERLTEEKRILYLAGVHPFTYWSTAFLWDFFVFGCSICLAVIVFQIFGLSTYVARDNLPAICLVLILFAWAVIPLTHFMEKIFDDASVVNMILFCVNTFIGVAALATILIIDILGNSKTAEDIREILHKIFLILPQYALGDSLVRMAKNDITAELLERFHMDTYVSPLGWELLGLHYVVFLVVGAIFYLLNLAIECRLVPGFPGYLYRIGKCNKNSDQDQIDNVNEDEDVLIERRRVEWSRESHDLLRVLNLRKEYQSVDSGKKVAVQDLSFGVQPGECFGLLGVNGVGKSTTFKMLTGEIEPTDGRIFVAGKEVGRRPDSSGRIGYCPQDDALDGFLTPREILSIHARLCGLRNVNTVVESTLERFDLTKYARQRVDRLSGGNRRKLCVARSVMSPGVSIVLMDEPSSGMDPASKELVARAVRRVVDNRGCVLLTSHSVAECENICTRVGVLGNGRIRCIGSPEGLKHKYGKGYVAFFRVATEYGGLVELKRAIARHLPEAIISSRQIRTARLLIPYRDEQIGGMEGDLKISEIFEKVKRIAEELGASDYTLNQSSLDQVLVNFSQPLQDDEDTKGSSGTSKNSKNNSPRKGNSVFNNEAFNSEDHIAMETF
ncbi:uncharacterized protein LOC107271675 isoform X2 [Cephus cinctus]|uniref:Uncharacterized protein LOC107271675 isoform X2 n=1 Tax=Cephus cinctus TaxID=211228 RepID=A0AAJ7RQ73_CEPCN|nr:uncharacterized protein LOC107271675 isoform X2 [Cephus cinctus]